MRLRRGWVGCLLLVGCQLGGSGSLTAREAGRGDAGVQFGGHVGKDAAVDASSVPVDRLDGAVPPLDAGLPDAAVSGDAAMGMGMDAALDPRIVPDVDVTPVAPKQRFPDQPLRERVAVTLAAPTQLLLDDSERVWFSNVQGVFRVEAGTVSTVSATAIGAGTTYYTPQVVRQPDDTMAIVMSDGLFTWDGVTLTGVTTWSDESQYSSLQHYKYVDNKLWHLSDGMARRMEAGGFVNANMVLADVVKGGAYHYGASRNEVLRWDGSEWEALYTAHPADRIRCVAVREDRIYAGTNGAVLVINTAGKLIARHTLGREIVQVIPRASGRLWAVPYHGGLLHYDGTEWSVDLRPVVARHDMLAVDATSQLWLGLVDGLYKDEESFVRQLVSRSIEDQYAGTQYFVSATSACQTLLHGGVISGRVACLARGGRTYLFLGSRLVVADDFAVELQDAFEGPYVPLTIGARSAAGTFAVIARDDGTQQAHVWRDGAWEHLDLPAGALDSWTAGSGATRGVIGVDEQEHVWLVGGMPNKLYRAAPGAGFKRVTLPYTGALCGFEVRQGRIVVRQDDSSVAPYCEWTLGYSNGAWVDASDWPKDTDEHYGFRSIVREGPEYEWHVGSDAAYDGLTLRHAETGAEIIATSRRDRLAVPLPRFFAADGLGNLWLLDSGGGIAVQSRRYLLSGTVEE